MRTSQFASFPLLISAQGDMNAMIVKVYSPYDLKLSELFRDARSSACSLKPLPGKPNTFSRRDGALQSSFVLQRRRKKQRSS
jgi:hypothetical protein